MNASFFELLLASLMIVVQQGSKKCTLVIRYLKSGYLTTDNSRLLEEFKLAYGKMALICSSSYQFMQ